MNKLFIGLLIVAAGAGVFFLLRKKKNSIVTNTINKEWIIGKWKVDSLQFPKDDTISDLERSGLALDTNYKKYTYAFTTDGYVLRSFPEILKTDTSYYKWTDTARLRWSRAANDTITTPLKVMRLDKTTLVLDPGNGGVSFKKQE
jgi:hypothetical protein